MEALGALFGEVSEALGGPLVTVLEAMGSAFGRFRKLWDVHLGTFGIHLGQFWNPWKMHLGRFGNNLGRFWRLCDVHLGGFGRPWEVDLGEYVPYIFKSSVFLG